MFTKWKQWNCHKIGFEGIKLKILRGELIVISQRAVADVVAAF